VSTEETLSRIAVQIAEATKAGNRALVTELYKLRRKAFEELQGGGPVGTADTSKEERKSEGTLPVAEHEDSGPPPELRARYQQAFQRLAEASQMLCEAERALVEARKLLT